MWGAEGGGRRGESKVRGEEGKKGEGTGWEWRKSRGKRGTGKEWEKEKERVRRKGK